MKKGKEGKSWSELQKNCQPSDSFSFLRISTRPPPSTHTRAKESSSPKEEPDYHFRPRWVSTCDF